MTLSHSITAETPQQKRSLSYANTILNLFQQIMESKQPADNHLANYFREHKKHGSKDRKIIRETLFALFRWWGWIKKVIPETSRKGVLDTSWLAAMSQCAILENHHFQTKNWYAVIESWQQLSGASIAATELGETEDHLKRIHTLNPNLSFTFDELLPQTFWQQLDSLNNTNKSKLIMSLLSRPPVYARAQNITRKALLKQLQQQEILATSVPFFDDAIEIGNSGLNLNGLKAYRNGQLEIQDLASQVIGNICDPKPNEHWWDTCSGAGGKALQLLSLMSQQDVVSGEVTVSDIRLNALQELTKRMSRASYTHFTVRPWQSGRLPVAEAAFDGVLVDAPCSCTGTWRRNPDMRWTDDLGNLEKLTKLQLDILERSSKAVKIGGKLIYATCSLLPQENEQIIAAFIKNNPEFSLERTRNPFTDEQSLMHTIWPFDANSDGMFVARMSKA
ncbi:MAG: RsmB/NOP family class I SAM-dependent RNA methyltransferase [Parashewanella sp.]